MKLFRLLILIVGALALAACSAPEPVALSGPVDCQPQNFTARATDVDWTPVEISTICSLWIGNLPELPDNPSNDYANNEAAIKLGQRLFFDTRMSLDGTISCATCHDPEYQFRDDDEQPVGGGPRRSQTLLGVAYSPWFFWDGHKDSLWAQALEPLESPVEHRGTREQYAALIASDAAYQAEYEAIFGVLPDVSTREGATEVFVNLGKAIEAYERLILPGASPFDQYAQALLANDDRTMKGALSAEEIQGLSIFMNEGRCTECHNGPLFTNNEFHNTAVFGTYDPGRLEGATAVLKDEFNCRSEYSDADESECDNLRFIRTEGFELDAAFKTPTLRNVADMPPYTHNGSFATLEAILVHYNLGGFGSSFGTVGHNQLVPLNLGEEELAALEAFLESLSGGLDMDESLLSAP